MKFNILLFFSTPSTYHPQWIWGRRAKSISKIDKNRRKVSHL